MKVAIFSNGCEIIAVGLDSDDNPLDECGTLFGKDSGRNIDDFDREDFVPESGDAAIVEVKTRIRVK